MKTILRFLTLSLSLLASSMSAQGVLDQPDQPLAWESHRDLSETAYEAKLDELKSKGLRPVEVEILGGSSRKYACIWRKNTDGRRWEVRTKLTEEAFSAKSEEMKNKGYRPIDQEVYQMKDKTYFGAIWIENKEHLKWTAFRKMGAEDFSQKLDAFKAQYLPVDVDAYEIGNVLYYAVIWVENKDNIDWAEKRNIPKTDFDKQFDDYANKGYRLYRAEAYQHNHKLEYATIWIKEANRRGWYARRDLNDTWFHNYWQRYKDLGYRLEDLDVYQTAEGVRYAGIWLENEVRVHWKHRDEVEKLVNTYFKKEPSVGMSIAVAVDGQIQYLRGWGFQDVKAEKEAHANTIYRHASIAKALASIIAFRLQAKKQLDLSKKTRDYEPRLPVHHTHTVGQLLSNRGKVRHYKDNDPAPLPGTPKVYANAYEASKLFSADPLVADAYCYSTHGYTLAAAAMEKATGKAYAKLLEDELTNPYGLNSLHCEDLKKNTAERSKIYAREGKGFKELTPVSLSWKFAGGGTESSVYDLARLGIKLLDGEILSKADLATMTTDPDTLANYAYGWNTGNHEGQKVFVKSGSQPGARAYLRCYPDKKIVIALLCNTQGEKLGDLARAIGLELIK